jgi:hypothetical protein
LLAQCAYLGLLFPQECPQRRLSLGGAPQTISFKSCLPCALFDPVEKPWHLSPPFESLAGTAPACAPSRPYYSIANTTKQAILWLAGSLQQHHGPHGKAATTKKRQLGAWA